MKYLVTGHQGKVGSGLVEKGAIPVDLELTDPDSMRDALIPYQDDEYVLIHTAAMTSVEDCQIKKSIAENINGYGTANLSDFIAPQSRMVYLSSCHVFDGSHVMAPPAEFHRPAAVNHYGVTKNIGELGLAYTESKGKMNIVRTSTLFTDETVLDIVNTARSGKQVEAVSFLHRSFGYLPDFVDVLWKYVTDGKFPVGRKSYPLKNILHIAGGIRISYEEFYKQIFDVFELDYKWLIIRRYDKSGFAPRPKRGGLNVNVAQKKGYGIRHYREALIEIRDAE